jgi:hypothetical protein
MVNLCQNSSGSNTSREGSNPRKASSKPGHLDSITLQAKPAENTRFVISASTRSSLSLRNALGVGLGRQKPSERFSAAFALLGPGADRFERRQALCPSF